MGIEGGGEWGVHPEIPHQASSETALESYERRRLEGGAEQRDSWLSGIIDPEKIERFRQYPAMEGHTTEWIIMEALLAKLVETGPEMDPHLRARLRNLVATFRVLALPNLNLCEQEFMRELASATTVDWSALRTDVTPETVEDIHWLWGTFGLQIPSRTQMRGALGAVGDGMRTILPKPQT